ncbi:MAG: hypothetical protein EP343_30130 [Deltaproteobacteria bacterium]|nr:MAG: hypothetical protein EP343_30130 [Deltaproteobacteria bacterium]
MKQAFPVWLTSLITGCLLLGAPVHTWAHGARCPIAGHVPPRSWSKTKIQFLPKNFHGVVGRWSTLLDDKLRPVYGKRKSPPPNYNPSTIKLLQMVMRNAFHMYRIHNFPFPSRWGIHSPQKGLEIYLADATPKPGGSPTLGWAKADCLKCGDIQGSLFVTVNFGDIALAGLRKDAFELVTTVGHELMHTVQYHSPWGNPCKKPIPDWWAESTANAIGYYMADHLPRKTRRLLGPSINNVSEAKRMGARDYNRYPLNNNGSTTASELIPYKTSSFWTHIARYYYRNSRAPYRFLKRMLYNPLYLTTKKNDLWLSLTHSLLLKEKKRTLAEIFGTFVTHAAAHRRTKDKELRDTQLLFDVNNLKKSPTVEPWAKSLRNDDSWLALWFGGCHTVQLNGSVKHPSSLPVQVKLKAWTAACIKVEVTGLPAGSSIPAIQVAAAAGSKSHATSQLRLGVGYTTTQEQFLCTTPRRNKPTTSSLAHCLLPPANGTVQKTWLVPGQQLAPQQSSFETLYVLSRAPAAQDCNSKSTKKSKTGQSPADCIPKLSRAARKAVPFTLTFSLLSAHELLQQKAPQASRKSKTKRRRANPKSAKKAIPAPRNYAVATLNTGFMHPDFASMPLSGSLHNFHPSRPVQHLFQGTWYNQVVAAKLQGLGKTGLRSIRYRRVKLVPMSNRLGEFELQTLATFTLALKKQLPFGKTGRFPGYLFGQSKENPHLKYVPHNQTSASLEVFEFSRRSFRARLTATLCKLSMYNVQTSDKLKCLAVERVQLDIIKPFPQYYTGTDTFETLDTAEMKQFRRYELPGMLRSARALRRAHQKKLRLSQSSKPSNDPIAAAMGQSCTCSCKEKERLEVLQRERLKKPNAQPKPEYIRLLLCNSPCHAKYSTCKSRTKSACDCSCSHRKRMLQLQIRLSQEGKEATPALMRYFRCAMNCAMAHVKCFKK